MGRVIKRRWVVETTWTCSSCDTVNRGRDTVCKNCGSPKEADEKYDRADPNATPAVTDPELLRLANAGANRHCPYCGADVRELNEVCTNCSATRDEHKEEVGDFNEAAVGLYEGAEERRGGGAEPSPAPLPPCPPAPLPPPENDWEPPKRRFPLTAVLAALGGLAVIGGIIWLCVYLFATHETDATVTGVRWEINAALRQKTLEHGEGWESSMPSDAFDRSCSQRQNGTEQYNPHDCNCRDVPYECNCTGGETEEYGCHPECSSDENGFEHCDEVCSTRTTPRTCETCYREECDTCYDERPTYADWCTYSYYDWPVVSRDRTAGTDFNVRPPVLTAHGSDQRLEIDEDYDVTFRADDRVLNHDVSSLSDFRRFPPGTRWRIKTNRAGQVWPLRPL